MKFQKFEHFFFIFGSILIVVFNAILVVFIGLVAFGIFKETSIIFFVKRLMSTTVAPIPAGESQDVTNKSCSMS